MASSSKRRPANSFKVIGRSTFDLQPGLRDHGRERGETVWRRARVRLPLRRRAPAVVATHNVSDALREVVRGTPQPARTPRRLRARRPRASHRAHQRRPGRPRLHVMDTACPTIAIRTVLAVPMLRAEELLGVIFVYRHEVRPFTDSQVALLETFADQAVIAIENVRLFTELQARNADLTEALEQQTATSEDPRVICSSPTDVQPVFDTIVENAVRLCGARMGAVYRFDGELMHLVAHHNYPPEVLEVLDACIRGRRSRPAVGPRRSSTRAVAQIQDVLADPRVSARRSRSPAAGEASWRYRCSARARPSGRSSSRETKPGPSPPGRSTSEDLRRPGRHRHRERPPLQGAGGPQPAISPRRSSSRRRPARSCGAISSAQTDAQPVFEAIVRNAVRLCDGFYSVLFSFDGEWIHVRAMHNVSRGRRRGLRAKVPDAGGRAAEHGRAGPHGRAACSASGTCMTKTRRCPRSRGAFRR